MKKINLLKIIQEEVKNLKEREPADVARLDRATGRHRTIDKAAQRINRPQEFAGAFEDWFTSLGFEPGSINRSRIRRDVENVLKKLGY